MCEDDPPRPDSTGILPAEHWVQAAQREGLDDTDGDSAVGSENSSSTATIASSILEYRSLHGRSYHSEQGNVQYWGANDEAQNEAMDINHHTLTVAIGDKLHLAPLEKDKVKKVLDIGTGTGIWAIDFADEYPGVEVVGTDVSPIQPSWVPPNLRFEIEDCTRDWTFAPGSIDYIHMRWLVGSIPDWDALYARAFKACKPGGWVESLEPSSVIASDDGTVPETSAMGQWGKFFIQGGKKIGSSFTVLEDGTQQNAAKAAGFSNIQEFNFKNPLGEWPKDPIEKEMGKYASYSLMTDIEGTVLFMAHTLGWSREEIQVYVAQLRRELRSGKFHGYFRQRVVWAQKPEIESEEAEA